jgi:PAS domain S-box-containing protein
VTVDVSEAMGTLPPADLGSAFTNSPMGVALATPEGVLIEANTALSELLGLNSTAMRGSTLFAVTHPEDLPGAVAVCNDLGLTRERTRHECRLVRSDGVIVPVQVTASWVDGSPGSAPPHLVLVVEDVTDRKALEARLLHLSAHDPLTGLPNRLLFHDRL